MNELVRDLAESLVGPREMAQTTMVQMMKDQTREAKIHAIEKRITTLIQQERQKGAREALEGVRPKLLEDVDEGDYYYGGTRRIDDIEGLIDEALKELE